MATFSSAYRYQSSRAFSDSNRQSVSSMSRGRLPDADTKIRAESDGNGAYLHRSPSWSSSTSSSVAEARCCTLCDKRLRGWNFKYWCITCDKLVCSDCSTTRRGLMRDSTSRSQSGLGFGKSSRGSVISKLVSTSSLRVMRPKQDHKSVRVCMQCDKRDNFFPICRTATFDDDSYLNEFGWPKVQTITTPQVQYLKTWNMNYSGDMFQDDLQEATNLDMALPHATPIGACSKLFEKMQHLPTPQQNDMARQKTDCTVTSSTRSHRDSHPVPHGFHSPFHSTSKGSKTVGFSDDVGSEASAPGLSPKTKRHGARWLATWTYELLPAVFVISSALIKYREEFKDEPWEEIHAIAQLLCLGVIILCTFTGGLKTIMSDVMDASKFVKNVSRHYCRSNVSGKFKPKRYIRFEKKATGVSFKTARSHLSEGRSPAKGSLQRGSMQLSTNALRLHDARSTK